MSENLPPRRQNGALGDYLLWEESREKFGNCSLTFRGSIGVRINGPILSSPRRAGPRRRTPAGATDDTMPKSKDCIRPPPDVIMNATMNRAPQQAAPRSRTGNAVRDFACS